MNKMAVARELMAIAKQLVSADKTVGEAARERMMKNTLTDLSQTIKGLDMLVSEFSDRPDVAREIHKASNVIDSIGVKLGKLLKSM